MVHRPRCRGVLQQQFFFLTKSTAVSKADIESNRGYQLFRAVSNEHGHIFSPVFSQYAERYPTTKTNVLAMERMEKMHAALQEYKSPPVGLANLVGTLIDRHIALATSDCESVFMAYRRGLAPEMRTTDPVSLSGTEKTVTSLWNKKDDHGALHRLMQKGGPFPTSVRYVGAQLERSLLNPLTCSVVSNMIRLSMLGAYSHSTYIAVPSLRCKIYGAEKKGLLELYSSLSSRTSHDYFFLVAEFVVAATRNAPMLWSWVSTHERYAEYEQLVCTASNDIRKGKRAPRIVNAASPRSWDPQATALSLVRATGNRKKLSREVQQVLTCQEIATIYKGVIVGQHWGYSTALIDFVGEAARALATSRTELVQRREFLALCKKNQAKTQVVAHALTARMSVDTAPLTQAIATQQAAAVLRRTGRRTHCVLVCLSCATWRSKANVLGISKGSVGVTVAFPLGSGIRCNGCRQQWGVVSVDLVGSALKIKPRAEGVPCWVTLCTNCGAPSSCMKHIGIAPVCKPCYAALSKPAGTCYACLSKVQLVRFTAKDAGRSIVLSSCNTHLPRVRGLEGVDVSVLLDLVPKRSRMYIR